MFYSVHYSIAFWTLYYFQRSLVELFILIVDDHLIENFAFSQFVSWSFFNFYLFEKTFLFLFCSRLNSTRSISLLWSEWSLKSSGTLTASMTITATPTETKALGRISTLDISCFLYKIMITWSRQRKGMTKKRSRQISLEFCYCKDCCKIGFYRVFEGFLKFKIELL